MPAVASGRIFPAAEDLFLNTVGQGLGKNIYDDARQTTCTEIVYHSGTVPMKTTMTVIARQFTLMTEAEYENFVCLCITSFGIYTEILEAWKHFPEKEKQTHEALKRATGMTFEILENMVHYSYLVHKLRKEIAEKTKFRLIKSHFGSG